MAEVYGGLDAKAKQGMTTSSDKTAAVEEAWKRIQSDGDPTTWAAFTLEGKNYVGTTGNDVDGFLASLTEDKVYFCGLRVDAKFFRILYVGADVGIIKKNKAHLQKNAPFNVMEGACADIDLPGPEKANLHDLLRPHL